MYQKKYTLKDIFNNKDLKDKIPLINYKESLQENGKVSRRTKAKTINTLVYDTSVSAARPYYKPLKASRSGDIVILGGNLTGKQNDAVNAVFNALQGKRMLMIWTANNADLVRSALKESERNRNSYGETSKLALKVGSMEEIKNMTNRQLAKLMHEITENIFYSDDFPKTQEKWGLKDIKVGVLSYEQRKEKWRRKVGE